jgi:hypothetical protein
MSVPFPKPQDIINSEVDFKAVKNLTSLDPLFKPGTPQDHPYYISYTEGNKEFNYWDEFGPTTYNYTTNNSATYKGLASVDDKYRYAVWTPRERYLNLFSDQSMNFMQRAIANLLEGVHPEGKTIMVPIDTIKSVASSVYTAAHQNVNVMQKMIISFIVETIKTDYGTEQKNKDLSIWVTKYDESTGMKQFNGIKLNKKMRTNVMQWKY